MPTEDTKCKSEKFDAVKFNCDGIKGITSEGNVVDIMNFNNVGSEPVANINSQINVPSIQIKGRPLESVVLEWVLNFMSGYMTLNQTDKSVEFKGDVTTDGKVNVKKDVVVEGKTELKQEVSVGGDLTVDGDIEAKDGDLIVNGDISTVGGDLTVDGDIETGEL